MLPFVSNAFPSTSDAKAAKPTISTRPTHRKMASSASSISIPQVSVSPEETRGPGVGKGDDEEPEQLTAIKLKMMSRTPSPEGLPPELGLVKGGLAKGKARARENDRMKDRQKQTDVDQDKNTDKLDVLGLGTPEVERWVAAGSLSSDDEPDTRQAGRRRVGFLEPEPEPEREVEIRSIEVEGGGNNNGQHLTVDGGASV